MKDELPPPILFGGSPCDLQWSRLISLLNERAFGRILRSPSTLVSDEKRVAIAVCEVNADIGLTLAAWNALDKPERVPWLARTIERLSGREETTPPVAPTTVLVTNERMESELSKKRKAGRPPVSVNAKIVAALLRHHQYNEDGSVMNREAARATELAAAADVSKMAVTRFLEKHFHKPAHVNYTAACNCGKIDTFLIVWADHVTKRLAPLAPNE